MYKSIIRLFIACFCLLFFLPNCAKRNSSDSAEAFPDGLEWAQGYWTSEECGVSILVKGLNIIRVNTFFSPNGSDGYKEIISELDQSNEVSCSLVGDDDWCYKLVDYLHLDSKEEVKYDPSHIFVFDIKHKKIFFHAGLSDNAIDDEWYLFEQIVL